MARLHLSFRNIKRGVKDAAEELFNANPWNLEVPEAIGVARTFVDKAAREYEVPVPQVDVNPMLVGASSYDNYDGQIYLRHFSIVNLFSAFRLHLLESGVDRSGSAEPYGWACSLFYAVRPSMFRARIREGRIHCEGLIEPRDTYTSETWQRMKDAGVVTVNAYGSEHMEVSNFDPDTLPVLESGRVSIRDLVARDQNAVVGDETPDSLEETPSEEPPTVDGSLEELSITDLRRLSRGGVVSGGYSMSKPALIAALREAGVVEGA